MAIYIVTLTGTLILSSIYERAQNRNLKRMAIICLIFFLVFISGFRYMNYYQSDEWNYRTMADAYKGKKFNLTDFFSKPEWLFVMIEWFAVNMFGDNQALIFITALITNVSIILFLRKYSYSFWFSMFLYIVSGSYFASMNVLRQFLALALTLWCYPLAKQKKFVKYLVVVVIASFIHQSAWVMLPLYLIFKDNSKSTYSYMLIAAMMIVFINFDLIIGKVISFTSYGHYLDNILNEGYGVSVIRIGAWLIPFTLIVIYQKNFIKYFGVDKSFIYAAILCICILILSSKYVFIARFDMYFVFPVYTIVGMIPLLFSKNSQKTVHACMVVLFFLFGAYQAYINPAYHNIIFENISGTL